MAGPVNAEAKLVTPSNLKVKKTKAHQRIVKLSTLRMPHHSPDVLRMVDYGVPAIMMRIVIAVLVNPALAFAGSIDCAELLAGPMEITKALQRSNLVTVPLEIKTDPMFDL